MQLVSACIGIVGSTFFAIGVMRQSIDAMAALSGTYFDWNPHMPKALGAQKADYLFGGGLIWIAFFLQLVSFLVPNATVLSSNQAKVAPWIAGMAAVVLFVLLKILSRMVSKRFEQQIWDRLKSKLKQHVSGRGDR
jgi:protein-S-isoprenylcysteine O-methyltransferase Ste14